MSQYIVFWKSKPGQQVSTVVDSHNQPVLRDDEYLSLNGVTLLSDPEAVFLALKQARGDKYAVHRGLARVTLGWDV